MKALNTLAHKLTDAQEQELREMGVESITPLPSEIANRLKDIRIDTDIKMLVNNLLNVFENGEFDYILLPCGNPLFAFMLARDMVYAGEKAIPLFAHSDRVTNEKQVTKTLQVLEDGEVVTKQITVVEKVTIFNHVKWIEA
jgi:hypothetical protein